jgi:hypothetical protein
MKENPIVKYLIKEKQNETNIPIAVNLYCRFVGKLQQRIEKQ